MTSARQLYELQELDWQIDRFQADLTSVEERLRDDSALVAARREVAEWTDNLRQLKTDHGGRDLEFQSLHGKLKTLEERLYSGAVKNPKELESLQSEIQYINEHAKHEEEEILGVMINLDEAEERVANATNELSGMEAEWEKTQATLSQERGKLADELASLSGKRGGLAGRSNPRDLTRYEKLRQTRQGHAVAKVERGMCQGCRITLPTQELQRVRTAREPVQCNSCGRILYLS